MSEIRLGVIGCGSIANHYHLPALKVIPRAYLATACDLIEERAVRAASDYGFEGWTLDYRDILDDPTIDAVFILTKIEAHAKLAIASANAGKWIFMQKPFAYSLGEGKEIVTSVQQAGVRLTPSFMHRYFDECVAARELIQSGSLGEIEFIRMRNGTQNPRWTAPSYGGALSDIGVHGIDLIQYLSGARILSVYAEIITDEPLMENRYGITGNLLGNELNAFLTYELSGGTRVAHEVQWSQRAGANRFEVEVYGTKGTLFIGAPLTGAKLWVASEDTGGVQKWVQPQVEQNSFGKLLHERFIGDMVDNTRGSQQVDDGFATLLVVEAARRSAATGSKVNVLRLEDIL